MVQNQDKGEERYQELLQKQGIESRLLYSLVPILKTECLVEIHPISEGLIPGDFSEYERLPFLKIWDFSNSYYAICGVGLLNISMLDFGVSVKNGSIDKSKNPEIFQRLQQGGTSDVDLPTMKVAKVDNMRKEVTFGGSFKSDMFRIDSETPYVLKFELTYIDLSILVDPIYKRLLFEGFEYLKAGQYGLSFFVTFTALESFVNQRIHSGELYNQLLEKYSSDDPKKHKVTDDGRIAIALSNKFKDVFNYYSDTGDNEIYRILKGKVKPLAGIRNSIAHGQEEQSVDSEQCLEILVVAMLAIYSIETGVKDFLEIDEFVFYNTDHFAIGKNAEWDIAI